MRIPSLFGVQVGLATTAGAQALLDNFPATDATMVKPYLLVSCSYRKHSTAAQGILHT